METDGYTLATLRPGDKAVIKSINHADTHVQRLMVLGLVEGAEVEATSTALGGDPIEFKLYDVSMSLRQEHARHFQVTLTAGSDATV